MTFGVVFKNRANEDPLTVFLTRASDTYRDGEEVDPGNVDAGWSKGSVRVVREFDAYNLKTKRPRRSLVVSRP